MKTKKSMPERFKKLGHYLDTKCDGMSSAHKALMIAESLFGRVFLGVTVEDYFQYGFYEKNWYGRSKYYTYGKRRKLTKKVNDEKEANIFKDKASFAKHFKKYMGRDILDMRDATKEAFDCFVKTKDKIFIKPIDGSWGAGTHLEDCSLELADRLYEKYGGKDVLAEELIKQSEDLARFNETSINSLRVVTFVKKDGNPVIMPGAILRLGRKGKIADNFHHNGIASFIDCETGIICTRGVDKEGKKYVVHPDSGVPIVGFKIPQWDRIKELALEAATVLPGVRCVGWDITITDDNRIIIIEGNDKADPDIAQMSLGEGVWDAYKSFR